MKSRAVWLGYIVIFSNLENGAGCLLSSLPAIRRLIGRTPSESSDAAADTSSCGRRASDRRFSKPIVRLPFYDDLTTVDPCTINDDHPKAVIIEQNIVNTVERDITYQASSSGHRDPYTYELASSHP